MDEAQRLLAEENAIYLTPLYFSEVGVDRAGSSVCCTRRRAGWRPLRAIGNRSGVAPSPPAEQMNGFPLAAQQHEAVQAALTHRVTVLTGGPGTGKTTTVRTIIDLCRAEQHHVLLAAQTSSTAKRMAETTGGKPRRFIVCLNSSPPKGWLFSATRKTRLKAIC